MSHAFRLGVFVFAALLIVTAAVFSISSSNSLLRPTYSLKAEFPNVVGLNTGADVRVGGIRQGSVRRLVLPSSPGGKVTVVVGLDSNTKKIIKTDSVAAIKSEGLLGDKYVEISFGSNEASTPQDGATISSEPPRDIADLVKAAGEVLDSTNSTMHNIDAISAKVNQGQGTMGALINDKHLYADARTATAKAASGVEAFSDDMDALKHNFFLRGFFNKRGYFENSAELTAHEIPRLPTGATDKTFTYDGEQMFSGNDSAKIKGESKLKEAGRFLGTNTSGLIVVTDRTTRAATGDTKKNLMLSQARAMNVREYLIKNFKVDEARIKTKGLGEAAEGEDSKLEILVYPSGGPPAATQTANKRP